MMRAEDIGPDEDLTGFITSGRNGSDQPYQHPDHKPTRGEAVRDALARCRQAAMASALDRRARYGEVLR